MTSPRIPLKTLTAPQLQPTWLPPASMALMLLSLAACGGGGGGSSASSAQNPNPSASMSVNTQSLSTAATTTQAAPGMSFQASVDGLDPGELVYLSVTTTHNGVLSVTPTPGNFLPVTLVVKLDAPDGMTPGNYDDSIQVSFCFDQACTQPVRDSPQSVRVHYTVTQSTFTVTSLGPSSTMAGGTSFTLAVFGSSFTPQSQVVWGTSAQQTTFVSATELTTQIPASQIADSGGALVSVTDPVNGITNKASFTIQRAPLAVTSLAPNSVAAGGGAFTLGVRGAGFSSGSSVQWNGTTLPATYSTDELLLVKVPAADIAAIGTAAVTVSDPSNTVPSAGPQTEAIVAGSKDSVTVGINPAHTNAVDFANISFPTHAAWSLDIGAAATYILITQGKVIVPEFQSDGTVDMIALDQATGTPLWGPVVTNGRYAAYDGGHVFVGATLPSLTSATLTAYDVNTGIQSWSTTLGSGSFFSSPVPTAAGGTVYAADDGGTLYAVDEATGALLWTRLGAAGTPAVSADGIYVSAECLDNDFLPATGDTIWTYQGPCTGGGGGTPALDNQLLYAPDVSLATDPNAVFDAATGTIVGSYPNSSRAAYGATFGYYLSGGGALSGVTLADDLSQWTFSGDGQLDRTPIIVGQYVLVASDSGNLYALDGTSGSQVWNVDLSPTYGAGSGDANGVLTAGDGLFVVSWGTKVVVYVLSTNP